MIPQQFVLLAAALNLAGLTAYIRDTLAGRTTPNRVSWFLWSLAPLIAFAAEVHQGVGWSSLMTFMVGFGPALVLVASFVSRHGAVQISRFDLGCGALSIAALVMWLITGKGNVAIAFSVAADALAAVPTLRKAWWDPGSETWIAFAASAASAFVTLLTISDWSFASAAFPVYILLLGSLLATLVRFPHLRVGSAAAAPTG